MKTVYLDTETTGLMPDDEVLEIALVGEHGELLFQSLIRPRRKIAWLEAQAVHGITPDKVRSAPYLSEVLPQLEALVKRNRLVIYNADYDLTYLPALRTSAAQVRCAMLRFAEWYGEWNTQKNSFRWQKLAVAAAHVGHPWGPEGPHRATADARACRSVWLWCEAQGESLGG